MYGVHDTEVEQHYKYKYEVISINDEVPEVVKEWRP